MTNLFIINLNYIKPLQEVDKYLVPHRAYLDEGYNSGILLVSGRKNPITGGIIIGKFSSADEANAFMSKDPFIINKVAEYSLTEFSPVKCNINVKSFLNI